MNKLHDLLNQSISCGFLVSILENLREDFGGNHSTLLKHKVKRINRLLHDGAIAAAILESLPIVQQAEVCESSSDDSHYLVVGVSTVGNIRLNSTLAETEIRDNELLGYWQTPGGAHNLSTGIIEIADIVSVSIFPAAY